MVQVIFAMRVDIGHNYYNLIVLASRRPIVCALVTYRKLYLRPDLFMLIPYLYNLLFRNNTRPHLFCSKNWSIQTILTCQCGQNISSIKGHSYAMILLSHFLRHDCLPEYHCIYRVPTRYDILM